jgi:hypothetical protein
MRRLPSAALLGVFLLVSLPGCSHDKGTPQEPSVDFREELDLAWGQFRAHDYSASAVSFRLLLRRFPDTTEPRVGLGWCELATDSLADAFETFQDAGGLRGGVDALAGLAVAASAMGQDSIAVEAASRAATDPLWVFVGGHDLGYRDLVFIEALGEFHLRRYEECYASLRILIPDLRIDLDAFDFREDLFSALESLRGQV